MTAPPLAPRFLPIGDAALSIEFGAAVDRALSARVLALEAAFAADPPPGLIETAPSFRALLVRFDPLSTDADAMRAAAQARLARADAAHGDEGRTEPARLWRLPVCYDPPFAPDLPELAERAGLSPEAVIARHAGQRHHVYMVGFLPGCPYLGDLPPELAPPRLATPRLKIPAGAVAVAVGLTVIYPVESPGGWRLIGRTVPKLFDAEREAAPALLRPGDQVMFERVDAAALANWTAADRPLAPVETAPS